MVHAEGCVCGSPWSWEAVALGPKSSASTAENGLNAGKTNPFMSKELFNYVWLINPNPLHYTYNLAIFNQVSCALRCGGNKRAIQKLEQMKRNKRHCTSIRSREPFRSQSFLWVCAGCRSLNEQSTWVPVKQLLLTSKGHTSLALRAFPVESQC